MAYDRFNLPRKSTRVPIRAELPTGSIPVLSPDIYYRPFISDTVSELKKGHSVTIFTREQLEDIKGIFGDLLKIRKMKDTEWWLCYINLKDIKKEGITLPDSPHSVKKRTDISKDDIMRLKKEGYTQPQICRKLRCSKTVYYKRLKETNNYEKKS